MISQNNKLVVVIGATGRQGGEVARHLMNNGWKVRALTRTPDSKKALALRKLGAEVVKGNLDDAASIVAALRGAYGVYNMQPPAPGKMERQIQQGITVAEAAKAAGIKHLVYGTAGPGKPDTGIEQWDAKVEILN